MPTGGLWSSGSRSASTAGWSRSRGACSNALLPEPPTPERCVEAYYLQRTRFEGIAERKLRRRAGDADGRRLRQGVWLVAEKSLVPDPFCPTARKPERPPVFRSVQAYRCERRRREEILGAQ
jgi:hypothetical protein